MSAPSTVIDLRIAETYTTPTVTYHPWMRHELGLRGVALDVYALVWAASAGHGAGYALTMSASQIADYLGASAWAAKKAIKELRGRGLVRVAARVRHTNGGRDGYALVAERPDVDNRVENSQQSVVFSRCPGLEGDPTTHCNSSAPNVVEKGHGNRAERVPARTQSFSTNQQRPLKVLDFSKTKASENGKGKSAERRAADAARLTQAISDINPTHMETWAAIESNCWRDADRRGLYRDEALANYLALIERGMHPKMILTAVINQRAWFSENAGSHPERFSLSRFLDPERPHVQISRMARSNGIDLAPASARRTRGKAARPKARAARTVKPSASGMPKLDPRATSISYEDYSRIFGVAL